MTQLGVTRSRRGSARQDGVERMVGIVTQDVGYEPTMQRKLGAAFVQMQQNMYL